MELFKLLLLVITIQCYYWHRGRAQLHSDVLLDLNAFDNTTLGYTDEYFELDEPFFLSDPNSTNMTLFSTIRSNWTAIYLLLFNGTRQETVDVFTEEARFSGRLDEDYRGLVSRTELSSLPPGLQDFVPSYSFASGMRLTENDLSVFTDGDGSLNDAEVDIALKAIGFEAQVHPGYDPRFVCVVAEDLFNTTTACVTLYFIGYNDDSPVIDYTALSNASFTEGRLNDVPIISGSLVVTDQDHPTRYPIMSARAWIQDFTGGDLELLTVAYDNPSFVYEFDSDTGILTITGEATADTYTEVLNSITYFNNMSEVFVNHRVISLTVNDGRFDSVQVDIFVAIVNSNDPPVISLMGEDPVITQQSFDYTEGSGLVVVAPNVTVVDTDPDAMIQRAQVSLVNPPDGDSELISLTTMDPMGLSIDTSDPHIIVINGLATSDVYTAVLRTLSYNHTDVAPGNPTTARPREIRFSVEDEQNVTNSQQTVLFINILPTNDAPILLYVSDPVQRGSSIPVLSGETLATFDYIEDDPAINFGRDIYLRDVDGNITSATLMLSGLLNGDQDFVTVDQALLVSAGLRMIRNRDIPQGEEVIRIEGEATPYQYEEVLRSLTYQNLYSTNHILDGNRNITIVTQDDGGLDSSFIYAVVTVMDRNDGPEVNIGGGLGNDFTVTFVEDSSSVHLATEHLTRLMDEEMHNISRLSLMLSATNGNLDDGETIFVRSPIVNIRPYLVPPITETSVIIAVNESVEFYEELLRNAYYYNPADEPTLFNASGSTLTRVVVIEITDNNFVQPGEDPNAEFNGDLGVSTTTVNVFVRIQPINDKRPRILINAEPQDCATDSSLQMAATESSSRRRRDLRAVSRIRKRAVGGVVDQSMAPKLVSSHASFTQLEHTRCLQSVQLVFNVNTSVPIIQAPRLLNQLMTFDPPELNAADKIGTWMDYRTMVVFFTECVPWPRVQSGSGRERVMNIAFESERGTCTWSSPCEQGVCFHNNTGCPITGYYQINTTCHHEDTPTDTTGSVQASAYSRTFFVIFGLAFVLFVILLVTTVLKECQRRNVKATKQELSSSALPTKFTPQSTSITMAPPITPPTKAIQSKEHSFVQDVELPVNTHHDTATKESTRVSTKMPESKSQSKSLSTSKKKSIRKRNNGRKSVSETSLSSNMNENDRLLSDIENEREDDGDGGGGVEARSGACDQSRDQSCGRIHGDSGTSTTNTSKHSNSKDIDSLNSSSNHSDRVTTLTRLSNNRQITPKATKTTQQHSKH